MDARGLFAVLPRKPCLTAPSWDPPSPTALSVIFGAHTRGLLPSVLAYISSCQDVSNHS